MTLEANPFEFKSFNNTHPELQAGEVFSLNIDKDRDEHFDRLKYTAKRKGETAYDDEGKVLANKVPVFVSQEEVAEMNRKSRERFERARVETNYEITEQSGDAAPEVVHDLGIRKNNLEDALAEVRVDEETQKLMEGRKTRNYSIRWKGERVPRGAVVGGRKIQHTQNGHVHDASGEIIGTYERVKDSDGGPDDENEMMVYIKE